MLATAIIISILFAFGGCGLQEENPPEPEVLLNNADIVQCTFLRGNSNVFPSINERPPEGLKQDGTKVRVLVVDDSMFVAKQIGQILSSEGYEIIATAAMMRIQIFFIVIIFSYCYYSI